MFLLNLLADIQLIVDFFLQADDRFFWNKFLQSRFIDITTSNPSQDVRMLLSLLLVQKLTMCFLSIVKPIYPPNNLWMWAQPTRLWPVHR
jgi:hypothetical protein